MNLNEVISLLQIEQGMPLVSVRFDDDTRAPDNPKGCYTYKCAVKHEVQPGEKVVVEVTAQNTLKVATVVAVLGPHELAHQGFDVDRLRHVVAVLDLSQIEKVRQAEHEVRHKLAMAEINERLASVRRYIPQGAMALAGSDAVKEATPRKTLVGVSVFALPNGVCAIKGLVHPSHDNTVVIVPTAIETPDGDTFRSAEGWKSELPVKLAQNMQFRSDHSGWFRIEEFE